MHHRRSPPPLRCQAAGCDFIGTRKTIKTHLCGPIIPIAASANKQSNCEHCGQLIGATTRDRDQHKPHCTHRTVAPLLRSSRLAANNDAADDDEEMPFDGGAAFDEDEDDAAAAVPIAAVVAPPPSPPLDPIGPPPVIDVAEELRHLHLFLANWALQHHISATAITQLLQYQQLLFRRLHLLQAVDADVNAAPLVMTPAAEKVCPHTCDKLISMAVPSDALIVQCYAMCPDERCGHMILLDSTRKLTKEQQLCQRPIVDITERPAQYDQEENVEPTRCNTLLTKTIDAKLDSSQRPKLVFSYRPLQLSLQQLLSRPGLEQECEVWRQRYDPNTNHLKSIQHFSNERVLSDIWDGRMWERYQFLTKNTQRPWEEYLESERKKYDELNQIVEERKISMNNAKGKKQRQVATTDYQTAVSERDQCDWSTIPEAEDEEKEGDIEKRERRIEAIEAARTPLLAQAGTLALALNIDWFQPFGGQQYSMGAMYMTILNLPREKRYLTENMILAGILPGPKETSRTQLQGACKPLRDELLQLLEGVPMKTADYPDGSHATRAFLLNIVCDIPAARALGGFAREASAWGCPYCSKRQHPKRKSCNHRDWRPWKYDVGHAKGEDQDRPRLTLEQLKAWAPREYETHMTNAKEWADSANKAHTATSVATETAQKKEFLKHGVRWSWLLDLPYWDPIRGMPIDVMHNVFLGTCKHIMSMMTGHGSEQMKDRAARKREKAEAAEARAKAKELAAEVDKKQRIKGPFLSPLIRSGPVTESARAARAKRRQRQEEEEQKNAADLEDNDPEQEEELEDEMPVVEHDGEVEADSDDIVLPSSEEKEVEEEEEEKKDEVEEEEVEVEDLESADSDDTSGDDEDEALVEFAPAAAAAAAPANNKRRAVSPPPDEVASSAKKAKTTVGAAAASASAGPATATSRARPAGGTVILTKSDLAAIQALLNAAQCPRDIGRIPGKIQTLSSVKANEWMNFFGIFAVPAIRELMRRGHTRLTANHLDIFILMQKAVTTLRSYAITETQINEVHAQLFEVAQLMAASFLNDDGSVTPNMHLSFHLRDQLLDFGPPAGWWCQPYERFNGLLGRVPVNRAKPAESTMTRGLKIVAAAGAACVEPNIHRFMHGEEFDTPVQREDCTISSRRTTSGRRNEYQWKSELVDALGIGAFLPFQANQLRRRGMLGHVAGDEPFAGEMRMSRTIKPILLDLRLKGQPFDPIQIDATRRIRKDRPPPKRQLVPVDEVLACLQPHYMETYKDDIFALAQREGDYSREEFKLLKDELKDTESTVPVRQKALVHPVVLSFFKQLTCQVRMYDTLTIAGETYGSSIGRNWRSSFVAVSFPEKESTITVAEVQSMNSFRTLWYGQVSYYLSHMYDGREHFFAACKWYLWVGGGKTSLGSSMRKHHPSPELQSKLAKQSLTNFPLLTTEFHGAHTQDTVPVQRIAFRWIPGKLTGKANKNKQLVFPVHTRVHA